jgi:hypothetical protein
MADKQQAGYIEQLKEMRALRTQQLKHQGADKAFYSSMTASQRMLVKSNEKMIASMENLSRSTLNGFKNLAVSVGSLAGKGVQATASGAAGLAGSIAGGLTKVLPLAIGGLLAKVMVWDNLTEDSKNQLSSSAANLFKSVFGGVPKYLADMINNLKDKLQSITITSPLFDALVKKAGVFVKLLTAGFDIIKPFFDQIYEFVSKDPAELIKNSLKAVGIGALTALLLPTATGILLALARNSLLMRMIDDAFDRRVGPGGVGGRQGPSGVVVGGLGGGNQSQSRGPQGQLRTPYGAGAAKAKSAATAAAAAAEARTGYQAVRTIGGRAAGALFGPIGMLLSVGYLGYEIISMLKSEGIPESDIKEALAEHGVDAYAFAGVSRLSEIETPTKQEFELFTKEGMRNEDAYQGTTLSRADVDKLNKVKKYRERVIDIAKQKREEETSDSPQFVRVAFDEIWKSFNKDERAFAIEYKRPIVETANFVYFAGVGGKIIKMSIADYNKMISGDDIITATPAQLEGSLKDLVKSRESPTMGGEASSYDVVFGYGQYAKPPKPLTEMTGVEVQEFQKKLVAETAKAGIGGGRGTGAVGAYQVTQTTLSDFYKANPDLRTKLFDQEVQDAFFKWRINKDMSDYISGKTTKPEFVERISGIWEAFGKNPKYKDDLSALIDDPSKFPVTPTAKLTEEQKSIKARVDRERFEQAYKELSEPLGNTAPLVVNGVDVAGKAVEQVEKVTERAKYTQFSVESFTSDFAQKTKELTDIVNSMFAAQTQQAPTIVADNSSVTNVINNSSGGGGGGPSINQVVSTHMSNMNWQFNSMSGGVRS